MDPKDSTTKAAVLAEMRRKELATREAIGISDAYAFSQLHYIECADTLVAEVYLRANSEHDHRLFARRRSERRYVLIGQPGDRADHRSTVSLPHLPFIYFCEWETGLRPDGSDCRGDWVSLQRLHLDDYRVERVLAAEELAVPSPYKRSWISDLLSITSDGQHVICRCGLERATDYGSAVDYFLCRLDCSDGAIERLTELEGVWF